MVKRRRKLFVLRASLGLFCGVVFFGCQISTERSFFQEGKSLVEAKQYDKALAKFDLVVKGYPRSEFAVKSAQEAARISALNLKNYKLATHFLKQTIVLSSRQDDVIVAQRQLADLLYDKLADYKQAVVEYNRLLEFPQPKIDVFTIRIALARANFYLGNFSQSFSEANQAFKESQNDEEKFQAEFIKGNILMAEKKAEESIVVLRRLLDNYPEQAQKENLGLTLAVSLEEKGDFNSAISILQRIRATYPIPGFIDTKIERLKERQAQLPGAQGFKK